MGSTSDLEVMTPAIETLEQFGIEVDKRVISAHRAPHELMKWAESARRCDCWTHLTPCDWCTYSQQNS